MSVNTSTIVDDSAILSCTIEGTQHVYDYTEYILRVYRQPFSDKTWQVLRRYSDFVELHSTLSTAGIDLPLPPKKVFRNKNKEFLGERQAGLQVYCNAVLSAHIVSQSPAVKVFFDPKNYADNYSDLALQRASLIFRSEPRWEIIRALPEIGWQTKKQYFLVKSVDSPDQKYMMSWNAYGPDRSLSDREITLGLKFLASLKHPNVYPVEYACSNENGGIVIQNVCSKGTLRDILCQSDYSHNVVKKYGDIRKYGPVQIGQIRGCAKQLIVVLLQMTNEGYPYYHLHSGNIIVEQGIFRILGLESGLFGLPSLYRSAIVKLKKCQSIESVNVYCLGRVLYELAVGRPMETDTCDEYPDTLHPHLKSVLESILTTEAVRGGIPSFRDLQEHIFFQEANGPPPPRANDKVSFRVPSSLKEALTHAKSKLESRIKEDHKWHRYYERYAKANAAIQAADVKPKTMKKLVSRYEAKTESLSVSMGAIRSSSPSASISTVNSSDDVAPPPGL